MSNLRSIYRVTMGSLGVFSASALAFSVDRCPYTGRFRLLTTTAEQEIEIGNRLSHSLISSLPSDRVLSSTHPLTRMCQKIVDRIVLNSSELVYSQYKVIVISDSLKDCFSLPNGDIVLHAGLLADIESETDLAIILSRAIAHAVLRHSSEVTSLIDLTRIPSRFLFQLVSFAGIGPLASAFKWLAQPSMSVSSPKLEAEAAVFALELLKNYQVELGTQISPDQQNLAYWKRRISTQIIP